MGILVLPTQTALTSTSLTIILHAASINAHAGLYTTGFSFCCGSIRVFTVARLSSSGIRRVILVKPLVTPFRGWPYYFYLLIAQTYSIVEAAAVSQAGLRASQFALQVNAGQYLTSLIFGDKKVGVTLRCSLQGAFHRAYGRVIFLIIAAFLASEHCASISAFQGLHELSRQAYHAALAAIVFVIALTEHFSSAAVGHLSREPTPRHFQVAITPSSRQSRSSPAASSPTSALSTSPMSH